jgi:hypothetical protein
MKIEFELTVQDYIAFEIFHQKNSKSGRKALLIARFVYPIFLLLFAFPMAMLTLIPFGLCVAICMIFIIGWIIKYPKVYRESTAKVITRRLSEGKNTVVIGKRTIELTESAIITEGEAGDSRIMWGFVERLFITKEHLFVYVSSVTAYIIPKRAFANTEELNKFVLIIKERAQIN